MRYRLVPSTNAELNQVTLTWVLGYRSSLSPSEIDVLSNYSKVLERREMGSESTSDYETLSAAVAQYDPEIALTYNPDNNRNHVSMMLLQDLLVTPIGSDSETMVALLQLRDDFSLFMANNEIVAVRDLHKNVINEVKRRKFSLTNLFLEAKMQDCSSIDNDYLLHFITKQSFLNMKHARELCILLLE